MTTYSQQNIKRQKTIRDPSRPADVGDYFPGIQKIEYKTNAHLLDDTLCYRYYNPLERIHGRTMEEWIKPAISFTAFKYDGSDYFGKPTYHRIWDDHSGSIENHKRCLKACFEFCTKLGIKYWSAFDNDMYPPSDNLDQAMQQSEDIIDFAVELQQHNHLRPLWIAPELRSDPKYAAGAITTNEANIFIAASHQTKRALEVAHKLNAECFLIRTGDEGYNTILNTDIQRELKQCSRFLKMISNYKERILYRGQLLMSEKKCKRDISSHWSSNAYDEYPDNKYFQSVSDVISFLKHYNLDRYFKTVAKPGHQISMAIGLNSAGCIELWDKNFNTKDATILMKTLIDQGGFLPGGININITPCRESFDIQDLYITYINIIDTLGKGLRIAAKIHAEQVFSKTIQQRYMSFCNGIGLRICNGEISFEDCEEQFRKLQGQVTELNSSAKNEHLQFILQRYVDSI